MKISSNHTKKINLGCASRLLEGYLNIDTDSLDCIEERYPSIQINRKCDFLQANFFDLEFEDNSLTEIRADSLIEHLSFKEEKIFFFKVRQLLTSGGMLYLETPDFNATVSKWIEANDDWKDFYRDDPDAIKDTHWFGTYSYGYDNKWGYLMASIFGPQNGEGQFHKNAYTENKFRSIFKYLDFADCEITRYQWKGNRDTMLKVKAFKK